MGVRDARHGTTTWAHARAAAREAGELCGPASVERVALGDAGGATLARGLTALAGVPAFDTAAMDGFAVAGEGPWVVAGRRLAGQPRGVDAAPLLPGQAVEIATGAWVPHGTRAVLPYEDAGPGADGGGNGAEKVRGRIGSGRHVRFAGSEIAPGTEVLSAGTAVTPTVLGLAASLGHDAVDVRRPRVAVLVTGDEVMGHGVPAAGRVRDSIGPVLPRLAAWAGAVAEPATHLGDDPAALDAALRSAAGDEGIAAVAVCGSSSKGPADHLRSVLGRLGAVTVVDGVACRPGHPQLMARIARAGAADLLVFGLPGNPFAALAAALTLLVPAVCALAHRREPGSARAPRLPLSTEVAPHARDTLLVAVRVADGAAHPVGRDRPGQLLGAALADALAVVPPGWRGPDAELVWLPD